MRPVSDAAPFCENFAKLYFDAKHLEEGFNRGWGNFWCLFFKKREVPFWLISNAALIFKIRPWTFKVCEKFFKMC